METTLRTGKDVLNDSELYVTKIGGDNAGKIRENLATVQERQGKGKKQILAVSAIRSSSEEFTTHSHELGRDKDSDGELKEGFNTTSHLIAIAKCIQSGDTSTAHEILERIRSFLKHIVHAEVEADSELDDASATTTLDEVIDSMLGELSLQIDAAAGFGKLHELKKDWVIQTEGGYYSITGVGELIAQAICQQYFALRDVNSGGIEIDGITDELLGENPQEVVEDENRVSDAIASLRTSMRSQVNGLLADNDLIISGGYLPVIASQRGYSDKTGALLAQVAKDLGHRVAYLIEKEWPIMSDDPRKNERARVIQEMTFTLAMELFGNTHGADGGAIHPDALNMLAEDDIDTVVLNPKYELRDDNSTYIHHYKPEPNGIEIIASREVPLAIQVSSTKMFGKPGFVGAVGTWFAEKDISIDQISTSERTTSFTFNNGAFDEPTLREFETFLQETFGPDDELALGVLRNQSLIFCLGNNMAKTGPAAQATMAIHLAGADIRFMTQGLNEQVMTFMIDERHTAKVREKLHRLGIEMGDDEFEAHLRNMRQALAT